MLCDVVCTGRFYDFVERHQGEWKLLHRQPIYEKDRIDPVDPGASLKLDQQLLAPLPEGYRHLAYIQTRIGYKVKLDMPMLKGPVVRAVPARRRWLPAARWSASQDAGHPRGVNRFPLLTKSNDMNVLGICGSLRQGFLQRDGAARRAEACARRRDGEHRGHQPHPVLQR